MSRFLRHSRNSITAGFPGQPGLKPNVPERVERGRDHMESVKVKDRRLEKANRPHDGSNGHILSLLWAGSSGLFLEAFGDLLEQLPEALEAAVGRANADGSLVKGKLVLHVWLTCKQGPHRSPAWALCVERFLRDYVTRQVTVVLHHLRSGPHDSRGPCARPCNSCGP